VISPICMN